MSNQNNHTDPDLERIKSIIIERVKKGSISPNDYWLLFILALFCKKMFNGDEITDIANELKKRINDDGEPS